MMQSRGAIRKRTERHRRVVITGIGAITAIGIGACGLWRGILHGESAARRISRFDPSGFRPQVAAEVHDFDPLDYMDAKKARWLDRFAQSSLAASRQALEDADLSPTGLDGCHAAVYLGSALGGIGFGEAQHSCYLANGLHSIDPSLALMVFAGSGASHIAIEFGITGPVVSNANSRAAGTMAIGEAFRLVRDGRADIALAGGAEAPLAPLTFGAFAHINALTSRNDDPQRACRPFDRDRDGFLMAEGGAVLVLEDAEHARERGAEPYAEIAGYATTNDAHHMVAPLPSGEQAARCMLLALKDAGLTPECVDYVSTHATGTPLGDAAEMRAIRHALADHADRVPVSSTKGLHGHALGATGPIEMAIVSLALQNAWLPPTTNLACPDSECKLAHVPPHGLSVKADVVIKNAFGFGGANTCLVLRRWREDDSLPG